MKTGTRSPLTGLMRVRAGEDAGLVLGLGLPLDVGLRGGVRAVRGDGLGRAWRGRRSTPHGCPRARRRGRSTCRPAVVLGRQHHVGRAEQGVLAGGEDGDAVVAGTDGEVDAGAFGAADPVALLQLDGLGPVQRVQVGQQAVRVGGDAHVPLAQLRLEDGVVAALGAAIGGDLLVGQYGAQARAPVDGRVRGVRQAIVAQQRRRARWRSARARSAGPGTARSPLSNWAISSSIGRARWPPRRTRS